MRGDIVCMHVHFEVCSLQNVFSLSTRIHCPCHGTRQKALHDAIQCVLYRMCSLHRERKTERERERDLVVDDGLLDIYIYIYIYIYMCVCVCVCACVCVHTHTYIYTLL
jgi:hypothetical protein